MQFKFPWTKETPPATVSRPQQSAPKTRRPQGFLKQVVLDYVSANPGPIVNKVISEAVGEDQSQVSHTLKTLVDQGLVAKRGKHYPYSYRALRKSVKKYQRRKTLVEPTVPPQPATKVSLPTKSVKLTGREYELVQFLKRHPNESISQATIGRAIGVKPGNVSVVVKQVERKGILYRSLPTVDGTKYRIEEPVQSDTLPVTASKTVTKPHNGDKFLTLVQSLIIEFMSETGKSDVAAFSRWIDKKTK